MSQAPPPSPPEVPEFEVEGPRRLSESIIWNLQRGFYLRAGPEAWKPKGVPSYVTNNAFIARAYARMAVALMRVVPAATPVTTPRAPTCMETVADPDSEEAHCAVSVMFCAVLLSKSAVAVKSAPQRRFGRISSIIHFISSGPTRPSALDDSMKNRLAT